MRWNIKRKRTPHWKKRFAWLPVKLNDVDQWCWLEYVYCAKKLKYDEHPKSNSYVSLKAVRDVNDYSYYVNQN